MITICPTTALLQARKQGKARAIRRRDAIPFEICQSTRDMCNDSKSKFICR